MFNRQPYNRGKFNVSSIGSSSASGISIMVLNSSIKATRIINASGKSSLMLGSGLNPTKIYIVNAGVSELTLDGDSISTKVYIVEVNPSNMALGTYANQTLAGESNIDLEGINLKPGDELVINTCDMTVAINGQNAIEYFSSDSEFFNLLSGLNTLVYSDTNSNREISFDVIWKDRWL